MGDTHLISDQLAVSDLDGSLVLLAVFLLGGTVLEEMHSYMIWVYLSHQLVQVLSISPAQST